MQEDLPSALENVPIAQFLQVAVAVCPCWSWYWPGVHRLPWQVVWPAWAACLPGSQSVQEAAPSVTLYCPATQSAQSVAAVTPAAELLPAAQGVHKSALVPALYRPAPQETQTSPLRAQSESVGIPVCFSDPGGQTEIPKTVVRPET